MKASAIAPAALLLLLSVISSSAGPIPSNSLAARNSADLAMLIARALNLEDLMGCGWVFDDKSDILEHAFLTDMDLKIRGTLPKEKGKQSKPGQPTTDEDGNVTAEIMAVHPSVTPAFKDCESPL
ncbi:hypothetical protein H0H87_012249, partial [Tephrocybe sp. NHM501043]